MRVGRSLDDYVAERRIADHHVLDVSDQVHRSIVDVADAARQGREVHAAVVDPVAAALSAQLRAMIDVDYCGKPARCRPWTEAEHAIGDHIPGSGTRTGRDSVERHTACSFLARRQTPRRSRGWPDAGRNSSRSLTTQTSIPPAPALPAGGVVMIRPDGHIGFRFPSTEVTTFAALDRHLASYLIPESSKDV